MDVLEHRTLLRTEVMCLFRKIFPIDNGRSVFIKEDEAENRSHRVRVRVENTYNKVICVCMLIHVF